MYKSALKINVKKTYFNLNHVKTKKTRIILKFLVVEYIMNKTILTELMDKV